MKNRDQVECFSIRLRELVERTGLSHSQFAASVGLTRATLSNYLTGRSEPGLGKLVFLCHKLDTTPNYLLGVDNTKDQNLDADVAKFPQADNNISEPRIGYEQPDKPQDTPTRLAQLEELTKSLLHTVNNTIPDFQKRIEALESR